MTHIPPAVRILPMDNMEEDFNGKSGKEVQRDFFLNKLPKSDGGYQYKKTGLQAEAGTIVLFQYDNQIIASATLRLPPATYDEPDGDYHGAFCFEVASIRVFDSVGPDVIREHWPRFGNFGRIKWNLSPAAYPAFRRRLKHVKGPEAVHSPLPEEIPEPILYVEGASRCVSINAYERDENARRRCIEHYGTNCCICKFSFGDFYGEDAAGYIHVHHLRPLAEIGEEYVVDPIDDLRPICPNCHAVVHLGGRCRSIREVQQLLKRRRKTQ